MMPVCRTTLKTGDVLVGSRLRSSTVSAAVRLPARPPGSNPPLVLFRPAGIDGGGRVRSPRPGHRLGYGPVVPHLLL